MSNLYDSANPEEVLERLYKQEETFVILKNTQLVTGGDLPARLWRYFKRGTLKAYLDHIGYVEANADVHVNLLAFGQYFVLWPISQHI
jgi:hypothetical protein